MSQLLHSEAITVVFHLCQKNQATARRAVEGRGAEVPHLPRRRHPPPRPVHEALPPHPSPAPENPGRDSEAAYWELASRRMLRGEGGAGRRKEGSRGKKGTTSGFVPRSVRAPRRSYSPPGRAPHSPEKVVAEGVAEVLLERLEGALLQYEEEGKEGKGGERQSTSTCNHSNLSSTISNPAPIGLQPLRSRCLANTTFP